MSAAGPARSMSGWAIFKGWARRRLARLRRRLPYLVWHGDEIDVGVTFFNFPLQEGLDLEGAYRHLHSGKIHEIEKALRDVGVTFDKGMGFGGRDWEWDWSLEGPISVSFRRRAKRPELRYSNRTLTNAADALHKIARRS